MSKNPAGTKCRVLDRPITYLGLDLSYGGSGLVVTDQDGKVLHHETYGTPAELAQDELRWHLLAKRVLWIIDTYRPRRAAMENAAFMGKGRRDRLAALAHIVRYWLFLFDIPCAMVAPATLKLWFANHGHASKDDMVEMARTMWPECPGDDEADAFALSLWAESHLEDLSNVDV